MTRPSYALNIGVVASAAIMNPIDEAGPPWSIPTLREPRYSQSLERGLAIMGCFTPQRPVLGIADIADSSA